MLKIALRSPIRRQANRAWLVKVALGLLLIMGLLQANNLSAQDPAAVLEFLEVELWPDFDQPALLVLMTGAFSNDVSLPATITLPLPEEATIHAVARVNAADEWIDMDYVDSISGQITLVVDDPGFHIEYYIPYESDGDLRQVTFRWLADMDVNQLLTKFQEPSSATDVTLSPEAMRALIGAYDLRYHEIEGQAVPAGIPYVLEASYRMVRPELSAEALDIQQAPPPVSAPAVTQQGVDGSDSSDFSWPMVLAAAVAVLAFAVVAWLIYSGQNRKRRVIKPRPAARTRRRQSPAGAGKSTSRGTSPKFCHECGQPLDPADKFCRNCGTVVKSGVK
jgi:hypothetical protein